MASTRKPDAMWAGRPQHQCRFCAFDTLHGADDVETHEIREHGDQLLALNDPLLEQATAPPAAATADTKTRLTTSAKAAKPVVQPPAEPVPAAAVTDTK